MRPHALGLAVMIAALPAVAAAKDLPKPVDQLLWCSSAFYWLASNAFDSGADKEAQRYETWSTRLMGKAIPDLRHAGRGDDDIQKLVEDYDSRVLDQIGAPDAPYEVTDCPGLVPNGSETK